MFLVKVFAFYSPKLKHKNQNKQKAENKRFYNFGTQFSKTKKLSNLVFQVFFFVEGTEYEPEKYYKLTVQRNNQKLLRKINIINKEWKESSSRKHEHD